MAEKTDLAQAQRLANGLDVFDHVCNGVLPGLLDLRRLARTALVNEHEPVGPHERQQIRKKVIVRSSGPAVDDHQWSPASHRLVVDQSATAVHEAVLVWKQVRGLGCLGGTGETSSARDEDDKQASSHAEMLARRINSGFGLSARGFWQARLYRAGLVSRKDFTTIWLGCMPTGMMVSKEYSEGSNFFFGMRFWITATSPEPESSTSR